MQPKFKFEQDKKQRQNLYASDYGKLEIDILLELAGIPHTNPPEWNDTLKWSAGKAIEEQMMKILKQNGVVALDYDQDNLPSTAITRCGAPITMRFDAQAGADITISSIDMGLGSTIEIKKGEPIEIKSVNNKNVQDITDYKNGFPRESYVGQLATYMDALEMKRGHLFVSTIDGLHTFWFVCELMEGPDLPSKRMYKCGNATIDLDKHYENLGKIWAKHLENGAWINKPNWFEETYKLPLDKIDWTKVTKTNIGEARNNRKVVGSEDSWKILYSPYRELILRMQGITFRGYTAEEVEIIKKATAGYSTAKKEE